MTEAAIKARRLYQKERRQSMTAEALEARRIYQREYKKKRMKEDPDYKRKQTEAHTNWQREHPDRCRAYQDKYWQKKAESLGLTD